MRRFIFAFTIAASLVCLLVGERGVSAESLSVATYYELSIARLELAQDTWERMRRSPTAAEESALWHQHGTTAEAYYAFASGHREEVRDYLMSSPEIQAQIEHLSERLDSLIEQAEGQ